MKNPILIVLIMVLLSNCQQKEAGTTTTSTESPTTNNQAATAKADKGTLNALGLGGQGVTLQREAIGLHDQVMAQNGKLIDLRQKAEKLLKENPQKKELQAVIDSLKSADKAMLEWMHSFKIARNPEDSIDYLKDRKSSMERIEQQTNRALELANQHLSK